MKARTIIATIILFMSFSYVHGQSVYSFSDGMNAAKSSGKKIVIDIFSGSDSWSKKMDSEVFTNSAVQSALSGFVFIKLDADGTGKYDYNGKQYSAKDLSSLFGGTGYPTFVFLNPDGSVIKFKYNGSEVSYLSGFIGASDFAEMLSFFSQDKYKTSDLSTIFND